MPSSMFVQPLLQGVFSLYIATVFSFSFFPFIADAAQSVQGNFFIAGDRAFTLPPLAKGIVEIGFKNTGTFSWTPALSKKLLLVSSAKKESYWYDPSWQSGTVVTSVQQAAKPGEVSYFRFTFEAPKVEGTFKETFKLFFNGRPVSNTDVSFTLTVKKTFQQALKKSTLALSSLPSPSSPSGSTSSSAFPQTSAKTFIASDSALTLEQFARAPFELGFKNTGALSWEGEEMKNITLRAAAKKESYWYDPSWQAGSVVGSLREAVLPGRVTYISFAVHAPMQTGTYEERFSLWYKETKISDDFIIPLIVKQRSSILAVALSPAPLMQATSSTPPALGVISDLTATEQLIRVGLFNTSDPVVVTSQRAYDVTDGNGVRFASLPASSVSTVLFDPLSKLYLLTTPSGTSTTSTFWRFSSPHTQGTSTWAFDPDTVFEIPSFSNHPGWSTIVNDNAFRGALEVRYSQKTERVWVINELPLEHYLRGIAETSNNSPYEYQKALIIAARTYAQYHVDRGTKYTGENFTVRSTDYDQVYRGYRAEERLPAVSRAVEETRGISVYYQGALVITPYYSQSDGRTRSWEEVWAGSSKPWLVSKDDPCCKGLPMLGHGVGMSARGALLMALNGRSFEDILRYYYTGIELRKKY